tara:strand:+ start:172 stop:396 length:225 start_codon:yes stop_codon:yes gene_type:complete
MILVFDSEKSNGFAIPIHTGTIKEAKDKAEKIIGDLGYEIDDWNLYEDDEPSEGEATFVYSHPCRHENITLFNV